MTINKIFDAINPECYNSVWDIAKASGYSQTTVRKYLKQLLEAKRIRVVDIGVYSTSNRYVVANWNRGQELVDSYWDPGIDKESDV